MPPRSTTERRKTALGLLLGVLLLSVLLIGLLGASAWQRYGDAVFGAEGSGSHVVQLPASDVLPTDVSYHVSATHPRILLNHAPTLTLLRNKLQADVPAARRFQSFVDAQVAGADAYGFQPWFAALMYRLTGEAAYAKYAIAKTDAAVAAEEELIARGRAADVSDDSYLGVGEIVGNLALVYDWCHDRLTPAQRSRWIGYGNQSVWNVWHPQRARWGDKTFAWTGWSVDNPSNNYYYSFLRATMLLGLATDGENDQAPVWLDTFRVDKLERQLFPTFRRDLKGGGSREGTGYGTAMRTLFMLLDWWERSTGERLADKTPHPYESMAALIHSTVPTLDRLAPTGDHARDSTAALFDYHRDYLQELIALYPDRPLAGAAVTYLHDSSVPAMKQGFNFYADFIYGDPAVAPRPLDQLPTAYHATGTGQVMLRSDWTRAAAYVNFICGPNTESHAHRDQGSFVLFRAGWLAPDANIYSHSGIEQAEDFHNLLRFEESGRTLRQKKGPGCDLRALHDDARFAYLRADLSASYRDQPAVKVDEREFVFLKPATFVVIDRAEVNPGIWRIWTLNVPVRPALRAEGYRLETGAASMDVQRLSPRGLVDRVVDRADPKAQISGGFRVDTVDERLANQPFVHVIRAGVTGAATATDVADGLLLTVDLGAQGVAELRIGASVGTTRMRLTSAGQVHFDGPMPGRVEQTAALPH